MMSHRGPRSAEQVWYLDLLLLLPSLIYAVLYATSLVHHFVFISLSVCLPITFLRVPKRLHSWSSFLGMSFQQDSFGTMRPTCQVHGNEETNLAILITPSSEDADEGVK